MIKEISNQSNYSYQPSNHHPDMIKGSCKILQQRNQPENFF